MQISRHIRHDYKTWAEWEQSSVRTVCGVTTRHGLAGIPGITLQPQIVDKGDKRYWGWCWPCVRSAYNEMTYVIASGKAGVFLDENLVRLYVNALHEIEQQFLKTEHKFGGRRRGADVVQ